VGHATRVYFWNRFSFDPRRLRDRILGNCFRQDSGRVSPLAVDYSSKTREINNSSSVGSRTPDGRTRTAYCLRNWRRSNPLRSFFITADHRPPGNNGSRVFIACVVSLIIGFLRGYYDARLETKVSYWFTRAYLSRGVRPSSSF